MGESVDLTGIAVAIGRLEESVNGVKNTQNNDISFQQSVRDTFTEHDRRITIIESSSKTTVKIFMFVTPLSVSIAVFVVNLLMK